MHGVQAIAKAAPAIERAAAAGPLDQRLDAPLAVELDDEELGDEEDAHRDDQDAGDLVERVLVLAQRLR